MTGQLGVVYLLHFDLPYKHARHYVGKPESSRFLKVRRVPVGRIWLNSRLVAVAGWLPQMGQSSCASGMASWRP